MAKPRRKNSYTILIVPDDNSEPANFKVSIRKLKILGVISIILALHIIIGVIFYFRFAVIYSVNQRLRKENVQLLKDNERVYQLAAEFNELENSQSKIRRILGLDHAEPASGDMQTDKISYNTEPVRLVAKESNRKVKALSPTRSSLQKQISFINQAKSAYHEMANNIPTLLPVEGFLTRDFQKPIDFEEQPHLGIDIAAQRGTIIRAAGSGIVVFANWTYNLGKTIIIYHGAGYFTYYGHSQRLLVKERAFVNKGDPIALMGSSGISSAPHLHFEVWKDGEPVDPKKYILALQNY